MLKITFGKNKRAAGIARTFEIYKGLVVRRAWVMGNTSDEELFEMSRRAVESFNQLTEEHYDR